MAGLTREGFIPLTQAEIEDRIKARLEAFSPGIDLSIEAPDGHLASIFSFAVGLAWSELANVYASYDPNAAVGAGLRNIGMISGLIYGAATRSQAVVNLVGTAGVLVPANSIVTDNDGNQFTTTLSGTIPASVQAIATVSGPINVDIGAINTIASPIAGWASVTQTQAGRVGGAAQTVDEYRNLRNRTVLRNYVSVPSVIQARLTEELSIEQVTVLNNDHPTAPLTDGTPAGHIHVTVGELDGAVTDEAVGQIILATKGLGCPTFGTTSVVVNDEQGKQHTINFSKATPQAIFMNIEVLFLDSDFAGAEENIRKDLVTHINGLATDEDVIWSRLFGIITKYSKAQVNVLDLSKDGVTYAPGNIVIGASEYANTTGGSINITVAN